MDAAANIGKLAASDLLLEHCFALEEEWPRPTARQRLDALLGAEFSRRLLHALCSGR